ncbi:hypothetical protein FWG86_01225 [Candidatus Saccharibacteria bacterium]|nr:hypothetical protein [Candidatus Saccharibacteria bacterium]
MRIKSKIALISLISAPLIVGGVLFFALRPSPEPVPSGNDPQITDTTPNPNDPNTGPQDPDPSDPNNNSSNGDSPSNNNSSNSNSNSSNNPSTPNPPNTQAARQAAIDRAMTYWRDYFRTEGYHNASCANNVCSGRGPNMDTFAGLYEVHTSSGEKKEDVSMSLSALLRIDFNAFTFRMTYYSADSRFSSVPANTTYYCTYNYKSNTTNCVDNIRPFLDLASGDKISPPVTGPVIRDFFNAHMERAGIKISDLTQ